MHDFVKKSPFFTTFFYKNRPPKAVFVNRFERTSANGGKEGRGIPLPSVALSLNLREQSKQCRDSVSFCAATELPESKLSAVLRPRKSAAFLRRHWFALHCAEEEGFEPPVRCRTTVFKTAAIDHSAIPPKQDCKGMDFLLF